MDNQKHTVHDTDVITVEDDGSDNAVRKYHRVERRESVDILGYDGEGVISREFAKVINKKLNGEHTSFQIRLPYIKGMLHQVDIHDFFKSAGVTTLTDIWGVVHKVSDVDIILTKSMFKGYGWLCENNMSWDDYWDAFRRYRHALYISGVSKDNPQKFTELNYQFLNTLSMTADEFRPLDLPLSFPENDNRHWLTKETEREYHRLCTDREYRLSFFTGKKHNRGTKEYFLKKILEKNPKFIAEPVYSDRLKSRAQAVLKQYALGRLIVAGDNRYLSADLLGFLKAFIPDKAKRNTSQRNFFDGAARSTFEKNAFYAPSMAYTHSNECTLLRNPHISRNEEVQLQVYPDVENMRKYYLSHLTDVVMVNWDSLTSERLGGADFDGDMIKTISDPIVNRCVKRNSKADTPLLKIPSAEPVIRDATDWQARFETVKSTFSSRVGQISNAALNRSIIAYNENSDDELRDKCREETETLAILTGLEIDSAKSGVKPDLTEYLGTKAVAKSKFLKYKSLLEKSEGRRAWYEPTFEEQFEKFFADTDWNKVDSNVERLPYLAYMLEKNTKTVVDKPADDSELFTFAADENWKDKLNDDKLKKLSALITDYERCLSRIRACGQPVKDRQRRNDIQRILYSRGQDREYDADMLYTLFQGTPPERITAIRQELQAKNWHLTPKEQREDFLADLIPELEQYYPLFSDFRFGGYRIFIDLIERVKPKINDILICRIGTLGKAIKITVDFEFSIFVSLGLIRLVDTTLIDFIITAINSPLGLKWIDENKVGGGTHTYKINLVDLPNMLIPIPPIAEQHRIVAKIEELLPYIERYGKAEEHLTALNTTFPEALKKSILQEAVQGKLVPQNPDDEPASVLLERTRAEKQTLIKAGKIKRDKHESVIVTRDKIPYEIIDGKERCIADEVPFELPESWCWCRLGSISKNIQYGTSQKSSKEGKMPVLRMGNLQDGRIIYDKLVYSSDDDEISRYPLLYNDLLFNRTNSREIVGKTAIYKAEMPAIYAGYLVRITPMIDSDYLNYVMQSQYYWIYCQTVRSDAIGQSNINAEKLKHFLVPVPPIEEQHRIVTKIEEIMPMIERLTLR